MYTYCGNNPVNMYDLQGNWPDFLESIASEIKRTAKFVGKVIASPLKAVEASVGAGIGFGGSTSVVVNGVEVGASAQWSITDSLTYEKGQFDTRTDETKSVGIQVASVIDYTVRCNSGHSFDDPKCDCNLWNDPFGERLNCPAQSPDFSNDVFLGISGGAFLIIGAEGYIGINLTTWVNELNTIWNEYKS